MIFSSIRNQVQDFAARQEDKDRVASAFFIVGVIAAILITFCDSCLLYALQFSLTQTEIADGMIGRLNTMIAVNMTLCTLFCALYFSLIRGYLGRIQGGVFLMIFSFIGNVWIVLCNGGFFAMTSTSLFYLPIVSVVMVNIKFGKWMTFITCLTFVFVFIYSYDKPMPIVTSTHSHALMNTIFCQLAISFLFWLLESERNLIYSELKFAAKKANEASVAKSLFIASMSHELRTPLHGILASADLLQEICQTEEQQTFISTIRACGKNLRSVVNNVLDLSQIEFGRIEPEFLNFDLFSLLQDVCDALAGFAESKNIELSLRIDPSISLSFQYCVGDSGRLRQVLTNLVANAIKFTQVGFVELSVSKDHKRLSSPHSVPIKFQVSDTGCGIESSFLNRIFEPFSQANLKFGKPYEGVGLGLCIAQKFVNLMKGRIFVRSSIGYGSTFWFTIPLTFPRNLNLDENSNENFPEQREAYFDVTIPCSVLHSGIQGQHSLSFGLCFPDSIFGKSIHDYLAGWGFSTSYVSLDTIYTAEEILNRFSRFDVLIIDEPEKVQLIMPLLNYCQTSLAPKKQIFFPVICFLTTSSRYSKMLDIFSQRFWSWNVQIISKPIGPTRFLLAIDQMIELKQKRRENFELMLQESQEKQGNRWNHSQTTPIQPVFQPQGQHRTVLIVEDNVINQLVLKHFLEKRENIRCEIVDTGKKAVEAWKVKKYPLIFMDIQMQGVNDGIEATKEIRKFERGSNTLQRTMIIALTGRAMKEDKEEALASGCDVFLTKPVDLEHLSQKLDVWLA